MSFLAPLYLLGGLAIALPVLFHMIRRTPRGRQAFSSLMFLAPSPPRITRRSRIEHWLLLLLRAAAVCLLALAFARPFWRQTEGLFGDPGDHRRMVLLLDTSASLRRDGLWDEARERIRTVLDDLRPGDQVAVLTFDRAASSLMGFDAWQATETTQRTAAVMGQLDTLSPTWRETRLGDALIAAAELLEDASTADADNVPREVVVVSDLQSGSDLASLDGYHWPDAVTLRLEPVGRDLPPANAAAQVVGDGAEAAADLRVRVTSTPNAQTETFQIGWVSPFAAASAAPPADTAGSDPLPSPAAALESEISVYIPPGQSRVVRIPRPEAAPSAGRLLLKGDQQAFDNLCYVAHRPLWKVTVVYRGDSPAPPTADAAEEPEDGPLDLGLRFYLAAAYPPTPAREVTLVDWPADQPHWPAETPRPQLVVVTAALAPDQTAALRAYVEQGGAVLLAGAAPEVYEVLSPLTGAAPAPVAEADITGYAMLVDIAFDHPLLAPFADPRYSDFTKLHFWKHRQLDHAAWPDSRILARFDDGDPALMEIPVKAGRVVVLAATWGRDDGELAVWSKFVPLMNRLLEYAGGDNAAPAQFTVGDPLPLTLLSPGAGDVASLTRPDGETVAIAAGQTVFDGLDEPGLYRARRNGRDDELSFAVNLAAAESRTDPLAPETLEAAGVRLALGEGAPHAASPAQQRQLHNRELEGRQKLWRWLLVAAAGLLCVETWLAGRLARRTAARTN